MENIHILCQKQVASANFCVTSKNVSIRIPDSQSVYVQVQFYGIEELKTLTSGNDNVPAVFLNSYHSIPCYQLQEACIAVSDNKMTITNITLTNQMRHYKSELNHLQQNLNKIDLSYQLQWCVFGCIIISGGTSE